MTKEQQRKVDLIRKHAENLWKDGNHEVKRFEVDDRNDKCRFVAVIAEVGLKGDEGTMAAIICRDKVHVFIGPRGAITYPVNDGRLKSGYRQVYHRYTSFLSTSIDQHIPVFSSKNRKRAGKD